MTIDEFYEAYDELYREFNEQMSGLYQQRFLPDTDQLEEKLAREIQKLHGQLSPEDQVIMMLEHGFNGKN